MGAFDHVESLLTGFPVKINPILAVLYIVSLAYFPHYLKFTFIIKRAKELKKRISIADSRSQSELFCDSSDSGSKIAHCVGCHINGLEALMCFGIALSLALITGVPKELLAGASGAFVVARSVYCFVYLTGLNGPLRPVVWSIGSFIWVSLLISASSRY